MKLKDVTIKNYKSFGNNDNFLFLDKLNVIIGKNESGKSNIIDSLSGIDTIGLTDEKYFISGAIVKSIVVLISHSDCSLLAYSSTINFCILFLFLETLQTS